MYDFIEGDLIAKSPAQAVIAAGGVGYRFTIPISTFEKLPASGRARLLTYLHVREDILRLYGFATADERIIFTHLLNVSGIGPSTAVAVLNGVSADEFRRAVASEQPGMLTKVKGIGRKTAERIVLELKGEMERQLAESPAGAAPGGTPMSDAVAAMLALGYTRTVSERAVARAIDKTGRDAPLEQVVREALQQV